MGRRVIEAGPWTLFGDCEVVRVVVDQDGVPGTGDACVVLWLVADVTFTAGATKTDGGYKLDYNGRQVAVDDVTLVGTVLSRRRVAVRG